MSASHLRLQQVVKSYDGRVNAVDGVSIDIARGEFVTFLGPSGSGKTTTLMMIAGFEDLTSGGIELNGRDLTRSKPHRRNIGIVFQNYALFPHMTAARNIAFPLRMRGVRPREIRQRVDSALELVGLSRFADKHPREMSGGQQQRVALARGLVFNPDVLLLDEPLGALDKNLREQMQVEIKRIHREVGITMIYVTHDQSEAMAMSDRIAVFGNGKLEQVAAPLEVYNRPATRFVGEFVGDSNFFEAWLDPARPGWAQIEGIGPIRLAEGTPAVAAGGSRVDILVRPERIRLAEGAAEPLNTINMTVQTLVEYGDSVLAIGTVSGRTLRMRLAGQTPEILRAQSQLCVGWAPRDAHAVPRAR